MSNNEIIFTNFENTDTNIYVPWFIDRLPDYNLINDHYMTTEYNTNSEESIPTDDTMPHLISESIQPLSDDFIPFQTIPIIEIFVKKFLIYNDEYSCCICCETKTIEQICQLNCNHKFCEGCTSYYLKNNRLPTCPLCRETITKIIVQTQEICNKF
jgi:hypothetical protein